MKFKFVVFERTLEMMENDVVDNVIFHFVREVL